MSSYPGGKGSVFRTIINQIPPHPVYIEPFLGGGAVMRQKKAAALNIGVDLNLRAVLDMADEMDAGDAVAAIGKNGAGAAALAGRVSVQTDWPRFEFYVMDALLFLGQYPFVGHEFVYCDPPYLLETRRSQRQLYLHEFDQESQHNDLLDLLLDLPCAVALSGYESDLYKDRLSRWRTISFEAQTRGGSTATEWLWMNYPPPEVLHDTSWLGKDYRQRERIKRKKARWVARLADMDDLERQALLDAIAEAGLLGSTMTAPGGIDEPPAPSPQTAGPDQDVDTPTWFDSLPGRTA